LNGDDERRPMSAQVSDSGKAAGSPAALEQEIQARREHLAATIDELTVRARPKEIARRAVAGVQGRVRELTHDPEGELRKERLAAVAAAITTLTGLLVMLRRRS
jgi:Protein of unknown function (DUF3618)